QGRRVAPVPLLPTLVLGALSIAAHGTDEQRAAWLPDVVAGEVVLTAALAEPGAVDPTRPRATATRDGTGWRLDGTKLSVPAAHIAARVLVPAQTDGGVELFLIDPAGPGVGATAAGDDRP
ncbi:MAG: acyl-CoA dehydrogenase, partial [Actinobacteria bacterium]